MDSDLLTYIAYIVLCYVIILMISRCVAHQFGDSGNDGGADTPDFPSGGGGDGDGKCDGNLLKNNCGQDSLNNWTVMSSQGDGWSIEGTPTGCDPLPTVDEDGNPIRDFAGCSSCFVTSTGLCMKEQLVDLISCGFTREYLDKNQPTIEISEWYAAHVDSASTYFLNVTLLDENKRNLGHYKAERAIPESLGKQWKKVSNKFNNYGAGMRYVSFGHGGSCSKNVPGQHGSKMSGGIVRVLDQQH